MRWFMVLATLATAASLAGCAEEKPDQPEPQTAAQGVMNGVVTDAAIRPIANATVSVLGTALAGSTGADGTFRFEDLLSGDYQVEVAKLGYTTTLQTVSVVSGREDPAFLRFVLVQDLDNTPYFELLSYDGYVEYAFALSNYGGTGSLTAFLGEESWRTFYTWDRIPDVFQGEVVWEPETDAARFMHYAWNGAAIGGESGVFDGFDTVNGTSPLSMRHAGSDLVDWGVPAERRMEARMTAQEDPNAPVSAAVLLHQPFRMFMTSFYGYAPPENWLFVIDGVYPPTLASLSL